MVGKTAGPVFGPTVGVRTETEWDEVPSMTRGKDDEDNYGDLDG